MSFSPRTSKLPFGSRSATVTVMLPSKRLLWLESAWPSNVVSLSNSLFKIGVPPDVTGRPAMIGNPVSTLLPFAVRRARFLRRIGALDEHDRENVADCARAQIHEQIEAAGACCRSLPGSGGGGAYVIDALRNSLRDSVSARSGALAQACSTSAASSQSTTSDHRDSSYKLLVRCWSIWSVVSIAREFISYARCVSIMDTSSSTTLTFEVSSAPCISVPSPFKPGVPGCGGPLD